MGTACGDGQISVAATSAPEGSGAGHNAVLLKFTNVSPANCSLTGYPGVDGLNASGASTAHASRTLNGYLSGCGCATPPLVTLTPGSSAWAQVEGYVDANPCLAFAALEVTPPNTTTSTTVGLSPYSCGFTVHPVVSNPSGSGSATGSPAAADFNAALSLWTQGASADSASQGQYWSGAAADLQAALTSDPSEAGYATAISELEQITALPDTGQTASQQAEEQADVSALNSFFGTTNLYN